MNEQIVIKTVIQRYVKDEHKVSLVIKEKRKKEKSWTRIFY